MPLEDKFVPRKSTQKVWSDIFVEEDGNGEKKYFLFDSRSLKKTLAKRKILKLAQNLVEFFIYYQSNINIKKMQIVKIV